VGRLGSNPGPADYEKHARPQHAPGLQRCHALVLREHTWRWDFLRRRSTPRSTPRTLGKAAPSGAAAGVVSRVSEREYSPAANIAVCSGLPNPDAVVVISGRYPLAAKPLATSVSPITKSDAAISSVNTGEAAACASLAL